MKPLEAANINAVHPFLSLAPMYCYNNKTPSTLFFYAAIINGVVSHLQLVLTLTYRSAMHSVYPVKTALSNAV